MEAKEALESIMLRAKEGRNKEQQIYIESNYELVKQSLTELEELKKRLLEKEKKDELVKHLIVLVIRYIGAVSYDADQTNYGLDIVKDIKETVKQLEEEVK